MTRFLLVKKSRKSVKRALVWLVLFTMFINIVAVSFADISNNNVAGNTNLLKLKDIPVGSVVVDEKAKWEFRDGQNYLGKNYKTESVKWKLINQGYFGMGKTLLITDEAVAFYNFDKSSNVFSKSELNKWLKEVFYKGFSIDFKGALDSFGSSSKTRLNSEQISILSMDELGLGNNSNSVKIDYLSNQQNRVMTEDSTVTKRSVKYWTSTAHEKETNQVYAVLQTGEAGTYDMKNGLTGVRPAVNLKNDTLVSGPFEKNGQSYYILFQESKANLNSSYTDKKEDQKPQGDSLKEDAVKSGDKTDEIFGKDEESLFKSELKERLRKVDVSNKLKGIKKTNNGFKNITYKLKEGVEEIDSKTASDITSNIQDGKISKEKIKELARFNKNDLLKGDHKYPGKIYVSKDAGIAFKLLEKESEPLESVEENENNTMSLSGKYLFAGTVKIQEILEDLNIPTQSINLTKDFLIPNSSDFPKDEENSNGIEVSETKSSTSGNVAASSGANQGTTQGVAGVSTMNAPPPPSSVDMEADVNAITFKLSDYKKKINLGDGKTANIRLDGSVKLEAPHIVGGYSWNDGYKLAFKAGEEVKLNLKADFQLKKKERLLLYGFSVDSAVGSAHAGLYIVIDVNGNIYLEVDFNQSASVEAGIRGGTTWGFPTSVHPYGDGDLNGNADIDISGKINGKAALAVGLGLSIFGCNVIDIEASLGLKVVGSFAIGTNAPPEQYFVTADIYLLVKAHVDYYFDSKNITILKKEKNLFSKYIRMTGDYKIILDKVCAYEDVVKGQIFNKRTDPPEAYNGKTNIRVNNGDPIEVSVVNGIFVQKNVALEKGSKVDVQVPGTNLWSNYCEATFPFDSITLNYADYFNKAIEGSIKSAIGYDGSTINYSGPVLLKIKYYDSVVYRGVAENSIIKVNGKIPGQEGLNNITRDTSVKLVLEKDGFAVESNNVETDGLIVSKINIVNLRVSYQFENGRTYYVPEELETYRADKVRVFVSNERGEEFPNNIPTGQVEIKLGIDFPHRIPGWNGDYFEESKGLDENYRLLNPLVLVGRANGIVVTGEKIDLKPLEGRNGVAIAEINGFEKTVKGNPSVRKNDMYGDKHTFEGLKFYFEDGVISYDLRALACKFCQDFMNPYKLEFIIDKMSKSQIFDNSFKDIKVNLDDIGMNGEITNPGRLDNDFDESTLSSWAVNGVNEANLGGLTTKRVMGSFKENITREEFAGLAVKLYEALSGKKAEALSSNPFSDTTDGDVLKAKKLGIINGVSATSFAPSKTVTRQEMCVMLQKTALAANPSMSVDTSGVGDFADETSIASWAKSSVKWASKTGIMGGVGNNQINPEGMATREQAIILVNKAKGNLVVK